MPDRAPAPLPPAPSVAVAEPARAGRSAARDGVAAVLWALAIVPAAVGFWLVAGSVAGVSAGQTHQLVAASLLALGIATVLQAGLGYRLPMYEGPAVAYLAAITVVAAQGGHGLAGITGGMLAAGALVVALGLLRVDRLMLALFTPLVANVFVLVVTLAVMPPTLERAVGAGHGLPGSVSGWVSTAVVVAVTIAVRRSPRLSPLSLVAALLCGTAAHIAIAGPPSAHVGSGLIAPTLLPWGSPDLSLAVLLPFLIAGALAAFNTIASGQVIAAAFQAPVGPRAARDSFVMHGLGQAAGAMIGNLVGTVSRLDSLGIVQVIDNRGRAPLLAASVLIGALAFLRPVVDVAAALPLDVCAALLAVLLGLIIAHVLGALLRGPRRVLLLVVAPSLLPTAVWIAIGSSLPPTAQLLGNPMLWGVLMAVVLERLVAPPARLAA